MTHREDHRDAEGAPLGPQAGQETGVMARNSRCQETERLRTKGQSMGECGEDLMVLISLMCFGDPEDTVSPGGMTSVNDGLLSAVSSVLGPTFHPLLLGGDRRTQSLPRHPVLPL